eukprot:2369601-Rhodomonas_salina.1
MRRAVDSVAKKGTDAHVNWRSATRQQPTARNHMTEPNPTCGPLPAVGLSSSSKREFEKELGRGFKVCLGGR